MAGKARRRDPRIAPGLSAVLLLTSVSVVLLLGLTGAAFWLPGSAIVDGLLRGLA